MGRCNRYFMSTITLIIHAAVCQAASDLGKNFGWSTGTSVIYWVSAGISPHGWSVSWPASNHCQPWLKPSIKYILGSVVVLYNHFLHW